MSNAAVVSVSSVMIPFPWMHRHLHRLVVAVFCLLCAMPVHAEQSLEKNVELLGNSTDFRVRTQAALALGASQSERAVTPLCKGLSDENRTVRIAAATALSRLQKGGQACLQQRAQREGDARVLAAIQRALTNLGGAEPLLGSSTKYWVAVQKIAGPPRLDDPVRGAMVKAAKGRSEVAFVPRGIALTEAQKMLDAHPGAKGFLLAPRLNRPTYEGGMLKVKMSVAIMSYPGNVLLGSFSKTVGLTGVTGPDQGSEDELVLLAAEEAMKQFLTLAPSLSP